MTKDLIYAYVDPRTLRNCYVGKSSTGMLRPRDIRGHNHGDCGQWLEELEALGLKPEIVVLAVIEGDPRAREENPCPWAADRNLTVLSNAEMWWIRHGRALGWPLTNMTDGSVGRPKTLPDDMTERLMIRTYPDDAARWQSAAEADGRTVSSWLRWLANREVKP
jgi:hypothetical protein